jgi:WD40 repeat protein
MNNTIHTASRKVGRIVLFLLGAAAGAVVLTGSTCSVFNKAPSVPVISGPSAGVVGVPVTFRATATDPEGDSIAFQFDWGDTAMPAWSTLVASGETLSASHAFCDTGTYLVMAKTKDANGRGTDWTEGHVISLIAAGPAYPDSVYDTVYVRNGGVACCISPDGTLLCVGPGYSSDSITIMRVSDHALLPRVRVDTMIGAAVFSSDNRSVYASGSNSGAIYRVDVASGRVVDSVPGIGPARDVLVSPDGSRLLVGASQYVLVLRSDSLAILDSVRLPYEVEAMALNQAGTILFAGVLHGLGVVDVPGCSLSMFTQAVDRPKYAVLSPDEESLYVFCSADSGVVVLRTSDLAVMRRVSMGVISPSHMKRTPDGAHLFVGYRGSRILDMRTLLPVDSVILSGGGRLAMHPSGDTVYIVGGTNLYVIGKQH